MGLGTNPKTNHFHKMVVKCTGCGLYFTNPIADRNSMIKYYSSYGETHPRRLGIAESSIQNTRAVNKKFATRLDLRYLDIGSACGEQMAAFIHEGWEAYGIELSESSVKFAREERKLQHVYNFEIEEAPFENNFFDYINFWHVIEHLRNPVVVLNKIFNWLKPGGILNLGTPNALTIYGWFAYKYYNRFDLGVDHTFDFSPKTLKSIIEKIGFSVEEHRVYKPNSVPKSPLKKLVNNLG